ncbi:hypothetical protein KOW79_008212 [Hemibagrus wyckioides]|uniref:TNFR-Cys domain-containing protein n=1 Tax=Hemibagrus wyckioides TaxID=337641 RepID=A0A9D3NSJ6_9TELE|nr:laminin subunit alpha-2 isoform X1 [Hemibagrus wyckioides]KAG7328268.1 hypothetical protein KOW79_008212 [Hemibagrus wyckioides]
MAHLGIQAVVVALACLFGAVSSQTTLTPALTATTIIENVTSTTVNESVTITTPFMLSTTTPGCSTLNTSSCEACAPGTYYDNETLLCSCCLEPGLCIFPRGCRSCSLGFYQPLAGQQTCLPCIPGFYTNLTGSPVCQACPPGSYTNESGSVSCQACAPGFYASRQNTTICNPCPEGTYCNSSSCAQCLMCPSGSETLQTGSMQCSPCRPGMYKTSNQKMCQICNSGFYQIHWGQENCDICPEDHYCPSPDVDPIQCPSDAFCPEGSTAPGYCMETFFRKAGDTCELAPLTIALIAIGGGLFLLFISFLVFRRRRDTDSELSLSRAPLLQKDRPSRHVYGVPCDADPVYAGW